MQTGTWVASKKPKIAASAMCLLRLLHQNTAFCSPLLAGEAWQLRNDSHRSFTCKTFLFFIPPLPYISQVSAQHKRGLHAEMHKKAYIRPSVSPPIASNFPPYPIFSLPACRSPSFFLAGWLAMRMANPSWVSGGYHHGDGALPHVSIDPPAG